ncbi:hypothetical protein ACVWVZ_000129 [Pseudomonas tolaasii]
MVFQDGKYLALCKERDALAAAFNGHAAVFPHAQCTLLKGLALFERDGKEIWRCNSSYAVMHFKLERIE